MSHGNPLSGRHRRFVFTVFRGDPPTWDDDRMLWLAYQPEITPTTGKLHWQCAVRFKNPLSWRSAQEALDVHESTHVELMRGTDYQAMDYCRKEESRVRGSTPQLYGQIPQEEEKGQGRRSDLERAAEDIASGCTVKQLATRYPGSFIRYHKGFQALRIALHSEPRRRSEVPDVYILYGPTRSGKTRWVYDRFNDDVYRKRPTIWWDGYFGQQCVLFDEFYGQIEYPLILEICDRYPLQEQTKGGHVDLQRSTKAFVFTSNRRVEDWWPLQADLAAFKSRIIAEIEFPLPADSPWANLPAMPDESRVSPHPSLLRVADGDRGHDVIDLSQN